MLGNYPGATSKIVCTKPVTLTFEHLSTLNVSGFVIECCGQGNSSALFVTLVHHFICKNSTSQYNDKTSLEVHHSTFTLKGNIIILNMGKGLVVTGSRAICMENHLFTNNLEGGLFFQRKHSEYQ